MNLIGGRKTDGSVSNATGGTNFLYDAACRMNLDFSKGMTLTWRPDDDLPSLVEVYGQTDGWNNDPVIMNFAYKGGARIAKFRNEFLTQTTTKTNEARYYLLGGKEIRVGEDGAIRSVIYPSFAGSARRTISYHSNFEQIDQKNEFYAKDYLGSTARVYAFNSGTWSLKLATENDAWGREIQSIETATEEIDDRFIGKRQDKEMGTRDHGARSMDLDLPVWLSPDQKKQFFNLYGYDGNFTNPLNSVDLTGNAKVKSYGRESSIPSENIISTNSDLGYRHDQIIFDTPQAIFNRGIMSDVGFFEEKGQVYGTGFQAMGRI